MWGGGGSWKSDMGVERVLGKVWGEERICIGVARASGNKVIVVALGRVMGKGS